MFRLVFACSAAWILLGASAFAAGEAKHSGVILSIDPNGQTITLEEMGSWTPPNHGLGTRSIQLTPETTVDMATRSNDGGPGEWPGGFRAALLRTSDLRRDDYATVTTETRDGRLVARAITVVRMTAAR